MLKGSSMVRPAAGIRRREKLDVAGSGTGVVCLVTASANPPPPTTHIGYIYMYVRILILFGARERQTNKKKRLKQEGLSTKLEWIKGQVKERREKKRYGMSKATKQLGLFIYYAPHSMMTSQFVPLRASKWEAVPNQAGSACQVPACMRMCMRM
ncbi:hypothetical protein L249_6572 [Ophiocordyceps polyrhachis-furcata BCC 54312]|uniref:Uncharacterized protein n=1 Tax=Ophiocordyceps polyrhachis-furcata BCC 54312 TaxID=1330021 RepID=A0A367LKD3_9HYPO|nr:hypothetical protein L249_6572 [Ophiocordyceps polyrhachis-furcata BCC 54312]